jgi:hypothetical protein
MSIGSSEGPIRLSLKTTVQRRVARALIGSTCSPSSLSV